MPRKLDNAKRDRIISAALEVSSRKGFASTTVKDIADAAEVAPGTVYTYFQDKSDLFRCVSQRSWDAFHAEVASVLGGGGTARQKISVVVREAMDRIKAVHPLVRSIYAESLDRTMLSENVTRVTAALADGLAREIPSESPWSCFDPGELFSGLRMLIIGILIESAMTPSDRLDVQLETIRSQLSGLLETHS